MSKARKRYSLEFKTKFILFYESLQAQLPVNKKSIWHLARISYIDRRNHGNNNRT